MSILRLQHTRSDGEVDTYHLKSVRRYHIGRGSNCEVRILDLKMSRQHCAIERQGSEWLVHDLGSTNGIKLDGSRVSGSAILGVGSVIKAGNTQLEISGIAVAGPEAGDDLTPVRQEALPDDENGEARPTAGRSEAADTDDADDAFEPQSEAPARGSGALHAPGRPPSDEFELSDEQPVIDIEDEDKAAPAEAERPPEHEPIVATDEPAATAAPEPDVAEFEPLDDGPAVPAVATAAEESPAPSATAAPAERESQRVKPVTIRVGTGSHAARKDGSSSLYINVMGRRIGPLSRAEAREVKARELKGTLTEADLDKYPGA